MYPEGWQNGGDNDCLARTRAVLTKHDSVDVVEDYEMSILIVGNCHIYQIASSLELIAEESVKALRDPLNCKRDPSLMGAAKENVAQATHIGVISTFRDDFLDIFPEALDRTYMIPHVRSAAFQPDIVEFAIGGKRVEGRMEVSHSRLILFGFLRGLDVATTRRLFTEEAYRLLGYIDEWERSLAWARHQSELTGWNVEDLYETWRRRGCFTHTPNHPKLFVLSDLAHGFAIRSGIPVLFCDARDLQMDKAAAHSIWPVYPELARHHGFEGNLRFKFVTRGQNIWENRKLTISLEEFITESYALYSTLPRDSLPRHLFEGERYDRLAALVAKPATRHRNVNPYQSLPDHHYWKRAVATPSSAEVDPVVASKFRLTPKDRVATAGSCFAQHISNTLASSGCNYFVAEQAPGGMTHTEASARNYGTFSARFGNIYTTRQLLQLLDRAYGRFHPALDHLVGDKGQFLDPWRPLIEPDGFSSLTALHADREAHLAAVRRMFEEMDIFVFTLGLTEGWRATIDGAVFPVAPGAITRSAEPDDFCFFNMSVQEVIDDLEHLHNILNIINPRLRTILTVSPVPLIATYEKRHVLTSTTYSKSVLRVAADHMDRAYDNVMYFPSYEIITGNFNRGAYFDADLRSVKRDGVDHVMRLFMRHCVNAATSHGIEAELTDARIVCDEEILD